MDTPQNIPVTEAPAETVSTVKPAKRKTTPPTNPPKALIAEINMLRGQIEALQKNCESAYEQSRLMRNKYDALLTKHNQTMACVRQIVATANLSIHLLGDDNYGN